MILAVIAVACGLAAAAWSVTMLRGYVSWGCVPGRELRASVAFALAVAVVLVVPPAVLSFTPGLAAAPAWVKVLFAIVWLTLFVAFLGLNGEEVRAARRLERRVGYYELSLRVTRRRLAFMLALFCFLVLVLLGAVTGLLLVVLVAPPPPGQDSARAIDIAALLGGLFSGMLGAWAIIRRLFARVGRMPPDEVAALTKER